MLRQLSIRDFVIVDRLDIEFDAGFTVFSGETGAGKSILIDALALILGARGDGSIVRNGAVRADLSAVFDAPPDVAEWLHEHALDDTGHAAEVLAATAASSARDKDMTKSSRGAKTSRATGNQASAMHAPPVMLRRVIDATGARSRAFINGTPATLGQLRELGEMLVDIHGQHAHQALMRPDAQRLLFDTHAGATQAAARTAAAWAAWRAARARIDDARKRAEQIQLEREQLAWQVNELETLAPQAGEWEEIGVEHKRLSHAASLIDGVQGAIDALSESDDALIGRVSAITSRLQALAEIDENLRDVLLALEPAQIQLQEAAYSLTHYAQRLDLDPQRLEQVDERMNALHAASRKFRIAPEALGDALGERRGRLAALDAEADFTALEKAEQDAAVAYRDAAHVLSTIRKAAAGVLSEGVTTGMQELSMVGGSFEVALTPVQSTRDGEHPNVVGGPNGLEQIEFLVAGHPGVPRRPLARVASGGELARISLALSVIASAASPTPTLIFDEVDTGIGGAVAEVVGRLLHQLGGMRQVLCVTHLPQVAARGDRHLRVTKQVRDVSADVVAGQPVDGGAQTESETVSAVTRIDGAERVEEIARMLGGIDITPTTRRHAKEMLAA
ncbi:DNA repair protein [Robbsia andropogonis]|uniref:DNA repair protein RecN n=1 Tax=Robbsia andropogonis TaxID=28092 RepID=A0A0F5K0J6_9BURK|nr:DNA repair protein RecN [Robbsia andropogonis]KKB63067.1 DNA repair protein [Robbsia andropogonis]